MINPYAGRPHILKHNRVERLYRGGAYLDRWQMLGIGKDGTMSEEFIVSTIPYIGPGTACNEGISLTCLYGNDISLKTMIEAGETDFLGKKYAGITGGHLGVLARVGDSMERLIIQAHPTGEFAKEYFHAPFGKTEAWYIIDTREADGSYCFAGFKTGVRKQDFEVAFRTGDSETMLDMLNKVHVHKGDFLLIPAGMVHAMGAGVTFLEFHEPCDYTMRYEAMYSSRTIPENELHYGLGTELLLSCIKETTYCVEEIESLVRRKPKLIKREPGGTVEELVSYCENPCFMVKRLTVNGELEVPIGSDSHCILVTVNHDVDLKWDSGSEAVGQGRGVVVPAGVKHLWIEGENAEVLAGYPFAVEKP